MRISAIYLASHPTKKIPEDLTSKIIQKLQSFNVKIFVEPWLGSYFNHRFDTLELSQMNRCDVLIVLGGDGTLLHLIPWAVKADIPILAINAGRIGFLTEVEQDELEDSLEALCKGDYQIDERMLLNVNFDDNEKSQIALNDVVVSRGSYSRLISIDAFISNDMIGRYRADGIIVSSPTGSTGYSLSAGGPIISPQLNCMVVTPICSHSLQHRPVVVNSEEKIRLELKCEKGAGLHLVVDGRKPLRINHDEIIEVTKSTKTVKLIRLQPLAFFSLVRKKLMEWSQ